MDCRPAVVVVERGTPRKWSSPTIAAVIYPRGLSPWRFFRPTHRSTTCLPVLSCQSFFQTVLEDDENILHPLQTRHKLIFSPPSRIQRSSATPKSPETQGRGDND